MSTVRADNVAPAAGGTSRNLPRGVAAAWMNLNGTGTIALRDSQNISGVVDNGTGDYTASFTSVMANANYASFGGAAANSLGNFGRVGQPGYTTHQVAGSIRIGCSAGTSVMEDVPYAHLEILGSLA